MSTKKRDFSLERKENTRNIETYEDDGRDPEKCEWAKKLFPGIYICTGNCGPCAAIRPENCDYISPNNIIKSIMGDIITVNQDNEGE